MDGVRSAIFKCICPNQSAVMIGLLGEHLLCRYGVRGFFVVELTIDTWPCKINKTSVVAASCLVKILTGQVMSNTAKTNEGSKLTFEGVL